MRGKNIQSIEKKILPNSRIPLIGVKNLKFHHKASQGETVIDITNLTVPPGRSNPSPNDLLKIRLKDFSENLVAPFQDTYDIKRPVRNLIIGVASPYKQVQPVSILNATSCESTGVIVSRVFSLLSIHPYTNFPFIIFERMLFI